MAITPSSASVHSVSTEEYFKPARVVKKGFWEHRDVRLVTGLCIVGAVFFGVAANVFAVGLCGAALLLFYAYKKFSIARSGKMPKKIRWDETSSRFCGLP